MADQALAWVRCDVCGLTLRAEQDELEGDIVVGGERRRYVTRDCPSRAQRTYRPCGGRLRDVTYA